MRLTGHSNSLPTGPLKGLRVLDITGAPGLLYTRMLADVGADVIRVEPPSGDPGRFKPPFYNDEIDQKAKDILARMERDRGTVIMQPWRSILSQRDPEFMEKWHELIMYTLIKERALSRQVKEIIVIVMDAMTGYKEGLRIHTRLALEVGVTEEEILEALEVASLLGLHNISIPLPAAMEECDNFKKP